MFYSKYKLLFQAYLSIPVLFSGLRKIPPISDVSFYFNFRYSRGSSFSLRGVNIFYGMITLGSVNSLLNSNWGVLLHW